MSRSGYSDDCENVELYRAAVDAAIQGKRGQAFFRDLLKALDALPQKRLIAEELQADGEVCALGSVAKLRGVNLQGVDPEDHVRLSKELNIARVLAAEVEFVNDDDFSYRDETPEQRFERVRKWAERQIWVWEAKP